MVSDPSVPNRKPRRRLSPSEKYEIYVAVLTGQATQREAADRYGGGPVDGRARVPGRQAGALDALAASLPGRSG